MHKMPMVFFSNPSTFFIYNMSCADQEGIRETQNIGFLSNTGPDPLKNHKASQPVFNVGPFIGTPAKRHLTGVSLADR